MSERAKSPSALEPERYELAAPPAYRFEVDRRGFFKFLGAGIVVVCVLTDAVVAQESGGRARGEALPTEIGAWMHIGEDGRVTVFTGKVEVGQNIRTSLSQAVAEELRVPISQIEMVMGDTRLTPFDMGTFGSRTTPTMNLQLRKAAAAAREVLIGLAAAQWKVDRLHLVADGGKVTEPATKRSIDYAALAKGQQLSETVAVDSSLIPAAQWTVAGQSLPRVDGLEFVTGKHRYPSDQKLPEMLHGKILRPAAFDASLASLDTKAAELIPGVSVVHDGNFVGVTAPTVETASRAIAAIKADWKSDPQPSNRELFDYLKKTPAEGNEPVEAVFDSGSVAQVMAAADHRLQQTYTVSYIAHVPLEPRAAVAQWAGDESDRLDGHATAIRSSRRTRRGIPHSRRQSSSADARHGFGLRWKAYGRSRDRGGAIGAGGEASGETGVDPRGRIYLGVLSSGGSDGSDRRGPKRWHVNRMGIP